jgi:hypothetical protein
MDFKGAYTLISFHPDSVQRMATELRNGLVIFFLCEFFGWTGTPFAFQVITRAVLWELQRRLPERLLIYIDDLIGCCLRKDVDRMLAEAKRFCNSLMGDGAIEDRKTE